MGNEVFMDFRLKFQRRKTLAIHIMPGAEVEVRAPNGTSKKAIVAFVRANQPWIDQTLAQQRIKDLTAPRWVNGAEHYVLGHALPLFCGASIETTLNKTLLDADYQIDGLSVFAVTCTLPQTSAKVELAVMTEYRLLAKAYFQARIDYWMQHELFSQKTKPALKIRKMKRRWGSYSMRGNLNLNLYLIRFPLSQIDLVIVHELCHMLEFNHSPRFYQLMDTVLPHWRELDRQLNASKIPAL